VCVARLAARLAAIAWLKAERSTLCGGSATPFYYAKHILRGHRGLLMDFRNADSFASQASKYLADPALRANVSQRASEYMRKLSWPKVGKQYALTLQAAAAATRSSSPLDADAVSSSAPS
jgi:hypothetical protein